MALGRTRRRATANGAAAAAPLPRMLALDLDAPGVLVRMPLQSSAWAEDVPPVPAGAAVSAAFSCDDAEAEHREALELLGYRVVGVREGAAAGEPASVDLLLPAGALDRHPEYARAILGQARHVWDLGFGPARRALEPSLRCHLGADD